MFSFVYESINSIKQVNKKTVLELIRINFKIKRNFIITLVFYELSYLTSFFFYSDNKKTFIRVLIYY